MPNGASRRALVDRLTVVGWLLLGSEIGFLLFQLERVRTVDGTRFATAWDQRVEVLSFLMLPPNLAALAPAAGVAALTTWLAGSDRSAWLDVLLRSVAGLSIALVFVGLASVIEIGQREGALELDSIFLRLGGMSLAAGLALLCRTADTGVPVTDGDDG